MKKIKDDAQILFYKASDGSELPVRYSAAYPTGAARFNVRHMAFFAKWGLASLCHTL